MSGNASSKVLVLPLPVPPTTASGKSRRSAMIRSCDVVKIAEAYTLSYGVCSNSPSRVGLRVNTTSAPRFRQ